LTPTQEQAVYQYATPAYGQLFKFCLRTGCRIGEYATLEARHIAFKPTSKGEMMVCTLAAHEHKSGSKTGKDRFIRSLDPEIITMVKEAMECHPTGKLFYTSRHKPWTGGSACSALKCTRLKIQEAGIDFTYNGKSISTHSTRHTFVKNELMAGRPPAIVAILVGDTIQMILTVYAKEIEEAGGMEEKLVAHL
jgi:integrase